MKTYHINILGFNRVAPVFLAGFITDALQALNCPEVTYVPRTFLRSESESQEKFEESMGGEFRSADVTVSIGVQMTQLLVRRGLPLLFTSVPDPVKVGVVKSLESPGGRVSGVCMADPCPVRQATQLKFLYPFVERILIPYDPTGLGGLQVDRVATLVAELEAVGFEVRAFEVFSSDEVIEIAEKNIVRFHAFLLMEGCQAAAGAHFALAHLCGTYERLFISGSGVGGIADGAALAYGTRSDALISALVSLVDRYCREQFELGALPVTVLPDVRQLYVNRFMLPWLPGDLFFYIVEHYSQHQHFRWIDCKSGVSMTKERNTS